MEKAWFCYEQGLMSLDLHPVIYHGEPPKGKQTLRKQLIQLGENDPRDLDALVAKYPLKVDQELKALGQP